MAKQETPELFAMIPFASRQFEKDSSYRGTKFAGDITAEDFASTVNKWYWEQYREELDKLFEDKQDKKAVASKWGEMPGLKEGYAPFCKHLFVPNFFTKASVGVCHGRVEWLLSSFPNGREYLL
tara:strand:- start:221 stop:592 length:372 start_codon:yes stop_codon:yes gene_type:complete